MSATTGCVDDNLICHINELRQIFGGQPISKRLLGGNFWCELGHTNYTVFFGTVGINNNVLSFGVVLAKSLYNAIGNRGIVQIYFNAKLFQVRV